MAEVAEAEVAQSDALFAAPARPRAVPFIGPEADGGSPGHASPAAAVVARHASAGYGNASTARLVSRLRIQRKAVVSMPGDSFEREAEAVATSVVSGGSAPAISPVSGGGASVARETAYEEPKKPPKESAEPVQRAGGGDVTPDVGDAADAAISNPGPGTPMHPATRGTLEARLQTDLGDVRIHDDATAQQHAAAVEARAFTHGNDIWLGAGESQSDLSLMAHETTHVVQQRGGSAVQRAPLVQRLIPDFILSGLADYARHIPGWTLFTVIIGFNPLTREAVPRTAINLLEGFFGLVPFGTLIFDALREHGIIDAAFAWVEGEMSRLDLSLNRIERTFSAAWDDVRLLQGFDYNLNVLRRHFGALYDDVVAFARSLVDQILRMIKEAVVGVAEGLLAENRAWALIKKILGHDPLRDVAVTATPTEILEDFLILIGKQQHLEQMRERGTVEETANWLATQIATFMSLLGELRGLIGRAWDAIQPANLPNLMNDMRALATDAGAFLQRVWDFASSVAIKVLQLIKDALLGWLSSFAHELPGFHLVTVIIGRNPFTNEEVPRTAQNIIRGFISLLPGGNEIYAHLEETGIVTGAAARIEGAMESLGINRAFIVGLFTGLWNSLSIEDLLTPIDTFTRIVAQFGEPIARLVEFVGVVLREMIFLILQMMNFPFDLIGSIVTNAMTAIEDIKRDPIGFLQHMLDAIKLGFSNFFDNIVTHLLGGLADWLFRGLRGAGIEPPADLTFASVLDFVLNVLGISMERIWEKLGNRIGAENVAMIRGVIDRLVGIWSFIKDVQERGVVAIWEYIEGQLSNLWNMVLQKAQDFIMERIIARAVQWLLSLLDVTGIMPVINAVMGFFNAVQSAIEYLRDILAIINDWVTTIAAVARGEIQPGAAKMEQGLANAIPVAIGFLANQFGLGNIGEKIGEIVEGLRGLVDQALDWLIDRAVSAMESLLASLGFGGEGTGDPEHDAAVAAGLAAIEPAEQPLLENGKITREHADQVAAGIRHDHPIFTRFEVVDGGASWNYAWAASEGDEVDTDAEKAEAAPTSDFVGLDPNDATIQDQLVAAGYRRPYTRSGRLIICRVDVTSGVPRLSVGPDGRIALGPTEDQADRGEVTVELEAILASVREHPHLDLFSIDPTRGLLRLGSSLRREALADYRPDSTEQMRRAIEALIGAEDETEDLVEIPVGVHAEDFEEAIRTRAIPAAVRTHGLRATAMSDELIDMFMDQIGHGWPPGWEVHHVVPTDWGGINNHSNYAAIPGALHQDITNWWNSLRARILRDADAKATREDGSSGEYRSVQFE